jgi:hypothetical protein
MTPGCQDKTHRLLYYERQLALDFSKKAELMDDKKGDL